MPGKSGDTLVFRRNNMLRHLDQDIRDHIEAETQENIEHGMSPEDARFAAIRRFGNVQQIKQQTRSVWINAGAEAAWQDAQYALRSFWRGKTFAIVAILTMAIGVAVSTSVFSVLDTVVLRPLPYPDANRLVSFSSGPSVSGATRFKPGIAGADFVEWRAHASSFDKLAGYSYADQTISTRSVAEHVRVVSIAGDLWDLVGARTIAGHLFESDSKLDQIVISQPLFDQQFKGDRRVIGHIVMLDGRPVTVAGVLSPSFRFYFPQDWWSGLAPAEASVFVPAPPQVRSKPSRLFVVGRLKLGVPAWRALMQIQAIESSILKTYPDRWFAGVSSMTLVALQTRLLGADRQGLLIMQVAGVVVLLISCVNIANLLLARGAARRQEIAIRTAIGAGAMRILRQFLTEGLMLAILGGITGLLLTRAILLLFIHYGPRTLPRLSEAVVDGRVVAFACVLCLGSAVLFGLAPAIGLWSNDPQNALRQGTRTSSGTLIAFRFRRALVACEIALAVVLLTAAGLMLKSFWRMYSNPPGFAPADTITMNVALSGAEYASKTNQERYFRQLLSRVSAFPGIQAFGIANAQDYIIQSKDPSNPPLVDQFRDSLVSAGYFRAIGMHLLKGRIFVPTDPPDATVINETMARRVFGDQDPLGKPINGLGRPVWVTGVVANLKYSKLDAAPGPEIFRSYVSNLDGGPVGMTLVVRMPRGPLGIVPELRQGLAAIDPTQPVYKIETLEQALSESLAVRRFELLLLAVFALAAFVIAVIGVYGVVQYSVTQRTKEIGIRVAVGAQQLQVVKLIATQGVATGLWGVAFGLAGAYGCTRLMASILYGVDAQDPSVFWTIAAILMSVVALASVAPACRAALLDPLLALRDE
jgi:putative ABC transport system permease protein